MPNNKWRSLNKLPPSLKLRFLTCRERDEAQITWKHFVNVSISSHYTPVFISLAGIHGMWQIKLPRSPGLKRPCFLLFLALKVTTEISITFPFLPLSYCTHRSEVDTDKLADGRYLTYMIWFRTKPPEERADSIGPSQGMWENTSERCSGVSTWVWTPSALPQPRRPSASAPWLRLLGSKSESHEVSSPINSLL